MIGRMLIAIAGALIITAGLLLAMDSVTSLFENRSGERYFRITDVLPRPDPGRPERPRPGSRAPASVELESSAPDTSVPIETPTLPDSDRPQPQPEVELLEPGSDPDRR